MKFLKPLTALVSSLFMISPLAGQDDAVDKIGTVNMPKLLGEYYKTAELSKVFEGYQAKILEQNEKEVEAIKQLLAEVEGISKEADNPTMPIEQKEELFRRGRGLQNEIQIMQQQRVEWLNRKRAAFKEKENVELGILRAEIIEMVKEVGETQGYDLVFDRAAVSATNVLVLSYAKDAADLTAVLLERINKDAPEETEEEKPE